MGAKGAGGGTHKHGMVLMVWGGCGEMSSLQADWHEGGLAGSAQLQGCPMASECQAWVG